LFGVFAFVQQATGWITREILRQARSRFPSAFAHELCSLRRGLFKVRQSFSHPGSVELIYGKHSHAALRATGTAGEPLSASTRGVSQRGIHDLNQRLVAGW
jgi:hypothetical protein